MPTPKTLYVAVIGVGGVGRAFLAQLEALSHRYLSSTNAPTQISLVYVSRSSKAILHEFHQPISFSNWAADLENTSSLPLPLAQLADYLAKRPAGAHAALVDNTSDQTIAEAYPLFLSHGISIVTPNKKAFSSGTTLWKSIFSAAANGTGPSTSGYVFHEASVGAGLPVISTLKELLETGDVVTRIEGVFSGTMSFLFNSFMPVGGGGGAFSAEVATARKLGYTEPDPREDLNGLDVARKATILARLAGVTVDGPTGFPVQSLIPKELEGVGSADEFMDRLAEFDAKIEEVKKAAEAEGKVLRYVGSVDLTEGRLEVGLQKFDAKHPLAALKGSDNCFNFYTKRYGASPLIVQGAGAGAEVTAMGVTGDLIRVIRLLQ